MTRKIITGVILLVAAIFAYDFFLKPPSFNAGAKAPPFTVDLIDGSEFSLSDVEGNYVLLDFWGSWCGPCRKEIPELKKLYTEFHDQSYTDADNFHIVSVALEKSDKYTKRIIEAEQLNWDYHIIEVNPVVLLSSIGQLYDVKDLPTKFLLNPKGEIMGTNLPMDELRKVLKERVK